MSPNIFNLTTFSLLKTGSHSCQFQNLPKTKLVLNDKPERSESDKFA